MARETLEHAAVWLLKRAPRRAFSTLVGMSSRIRLPAAVQTRLLGAYSRLFGASPEEADRTLGDYSSVNDFFVRRLRPDCRPIDPSDTTAVSPVDATLVHLGVASQNSLIQAKGIEYDLERLLGTPDVARPFRNGPYATLWLKPGYYHRIHSPLKGTVRTVLWIPGDRYPVIPLTVRRLPELYNLNERKVVVLDTPCGLAAVVMVAALGVSNITLSLPFENGLPSRPKPGRVYRLSSAREYLVQKGDELGVFQLGSTVIVLFEPGRVELSPIEPGNRIRMGEPLAAQPSPTREGSLS